jgi:hypothetical protein
MATAAMESSSSNNNKGATESGDNSFQGAAGWRKQLSILHKRTPVKGGGEDLRFAKFPSLWYLILPS